MMLGAWVTIVTAVFLVVPGALVGRRLALPWPVAIAAGPPLTFVIVGLFTVLYGAIGFEWNLITALLALIITLLLAWVIAVGLRTGVGRRWLPASPGVVEDAVVDDAVVDDVPDGAENGDPAVDAPLGRTGVIGAAIGLAVGAVIIAVTCIRPIATTAFAGLDNIPQIWDSLWHASSLRWIHETGVGSSLRMGELMNYETAGFNYYPNTWHALGALLFPVTGANPVELYNTYSPAVLAITVPFGVASLAYWFARHRLAPDHAALIAGVSGAVAALFPSLPYVEIELTSVPNAVGVSMAPIAAVLTISAVTDRRRVIPAGLAIAGVTSTHPSGLVLIAVIVGLWWVLEGLWHPAYGRLRDLLSPLVTGAIALILIGPVIYGTVKIADNNELSGFDFRDETATVLEALKQGALNGTVPLDRSYPVWWLVILSFLGLLVMVWMRCWAGIATWLVMILVTANSVVELSPLSRALGALGGYFYNSGHRLTFVTAMFSAAAAGLALGFAALWAGRVVARRFSSEPTVGPTADPVTGSTHIQPRALRWAIPAAFAVVLLLIGAGAVVRYPTNAQIAAKQRDGRLVGPDDLAAYRWLAEQPDAHDALILNNLDQGTGWLYPVTGLTPMFPFYRANDFSQRQRDLFWGVAEIGSSEKIDQIVRDMNGHYVIDSPPSYWAFQRGAPDAARGHQGDPFLYLRQHGAPGLTPVFTQGNVTVYRVDDAVLAR